MRNAYELRNHFFLEDYNTAITREDFETFFTKTKEKVLCSRVATGISWSSLGGLKRVKPPEAFGERSRDWSLGYAGL